MNQSKITQRSWYIADAKNKILGRLSSNIARYLIGKHKMEYAPYIDSGDYVIVINSKEIVVTGSKYKNKIYYRHTGFVGGIKQLTFKQMITYYPNRVIEIAVRGMLPKNKLGRVMFKRLKVYSGSNHNHIAQSPQFLKDV